MGLEGRLVMLRRALTIVATVAVIATTAGCDLDEQAAPSDTATTATNPTIADNTERNTIVAGNEDVDEAVWDFRTPKTPIDMGSSVDEFVELDGPVELEVIFPSGRSVTGMWARGAVGYAEGGANLGTQAPQPINQVDLVEDEVDNVEDLRAAAQRFINEFGPAVSGSYEVSIEEFLDGFETRVASEGNGEIRAMDHGTFEGGGSTARSFTAADQDGLEASWLIRVVPGGVTVRTTVVFSPTTGTTSDQPSSGETV